MSIDDSESDISKERKRQYYVKTILRRNNMFTTKEG